MAYEYLGIPPNQVGDYTPVEIEMMVTVAVRKWKNEQKLADLRTARICSILSSSEKSKHPPKEFMIDYDKKPDENQYKTPEEMDVILRSMAAQFGAEVTNG